MINRFIVMCIIPARGGSKGVQRKNIRDFAGKPLIAYTIEQARRSRYIDRVIVSTEDTEIAVVSRRYGAEVPFERPWYLADDSTSTIDVLLHAIQWLEENEGYSCDIVVLLHATSPLREVGDIDSCIEQLTETGADSVFSVTKAANNPYFNMVEISKNGRIRLAKKGSFSTRQSAPTVYDMNASIYAWWKDILVKRKRVILPKSGIYVMPRERSIDIDDEMDFKIAESFRKDV